MKLFSQRTIQAKLTIIMMAVSAVAIVVAGLYAFAIGIYFGVNSLKSDLVTMAQVLGDNCQASLTFAVPDDAAQILSSLKNKPSIDAAGVYDAGGRLFASYGRNGLRPPGAAPKPAGPRLSWSSLEVVQPIDFKGKVIGSIYLRNDSSQARAALLDYSVMILACMAVSFGIAYLLALGMRGTVSRPILRLAALARRVSRDQDYSIRAEPAGEDEVGELIGSFNRMLDQIQSRDRSLRSSEEKFAQAFNLSPAMMILVEYGSGIIRDVNAAWLQVMGVSREELVGRKLTGPRLDPDPAVRQRLRSGLEQRGQVRNLEISPRAWGGEEKTIILSAELIEIGGEKFVIAAGDDVTERRQMAEQLLQSRKMEAVGRLAGGVAHDFNNVLAGIRGYAEIIGFRPENPAEVRKYSANIVQLSERAASLTRQLLAFSRRGKIQETRVDVHELVQEVSSLLQHTIDRRILVRAELSAPRHFVTGDPSQLLNAILNVAVNARDAMSDGGQLTFSTRVLSAAAARAAGMAEPEADEYLLLTVSDTGVGMGEDVKRHIFEPFFTTKEIGRGTGLGLAAVYGTIKGHQGDVVVESEPGKGSSFHLFLPLSPPADSPDRAVERQVIRGRGLVLLVDDEDALREVGRQMLEEMGYEVVLAENGKRAVEVYSARQDQIRLVILDVVMPVMNGVEAYALIRAANPQAKVIIASGFMPDQETANLLRQGIQAVITKPFSMQELSAKLDQVLGAR